MSFTGCLQDPNCFQNLTYLSVLMREILTHFLSYLQIPDSPTEAEADETARKKGGKQKEKKKEKPKGKVCIN